MSHLWATPVQPIPQLRTTEEFHELLAKPLVIIFKHSAACDRSRTAHEEMKRFQAVRPKAPVYLVSVIGCRDLSQYIAEHTGIQHASPQLIILRHGKVIASASHGNVSAELVHSFFEIG